MSSSLVVSTDSHNLPVLIVDKEGSIGLALAERLREYLQVVLVGSREPLNAHNILFLRFLDTTLQIPGDQYSHLFFIASSEKEMDQFLDVFVAKARADNAHLVVITYLRLLSRERIENIINEQGKISVIVVGDIFGEQVGHMDSPINHLFAQVKRKSRIILPGMGLNVIHPTPFNELIGQIVQIGFTTYSGKKEYLCFLRHPITELGLVHALQKVDPMIQLDFSPTAIEEKHFDITGEYVLPEDPQIFDKLQKAYAAKSLPRETEKSAIFPSKQKESTQTFWQDEKKSLSVPWISLFIFFVCLLLLLPSIVTGVGIFSGGVLLELAEKSLEKGSLQQAQHYVEFSIEAFAIGRKSLLLLQLETQPLKLQGLQITLTDSIHVGEVGDAVISSLVSAGTDFQSEQPHIGDAVAQIKDSLMQLAEIDHTAVLPGTLQTMLSATANMRSLFINLSDSLPVLLGDQGRKTYLVLFQNNTELRPGGGFIGSYALVDVAQGKVSNFSIYDVYDADGQLKGHIEPPFPIRRYLPSAHWYLRDSNFDVDFTRDASSAAFFLQQEKGVDVDGVVGVDLSFVRSLIGALESVYVPEYNQTVTADNLFMLTETHAEKNFFPGSTQKKDFLQSLFSALQTKLQSRQSLNYEKLANALADGLTQKHILISVRDSAVQDVLTANNLSSSLWDGRAQTDNTILDFLGINEANLGVSKVNYYMQRNIDDHVVVDGGGNISHALTIAYTNTSKSGEGFGGDYKNYLRLILPRGATITDITIDGISQKIVPAVTNFLVYEKPSFAPPAGLEVDREEEQGKTIYGMLVIVPQGKKKNIGISYSLAQKLDITQPVGEYNLLFFKQPGIDSIPFAFSFMYPSAYSVLQTSSDMIAGQEVSFTQNVTTDTVLDITLGKK